jgi:Trk-type K+ transport system membrane component
MKRIRRPAFWLPAALLLMLLLGARLLHLPACTQLSERDRGSYGLLPLWRVHFDALSSACGVGLLQYDLEHEYTATGRWLLALMGVGGALLYLAAGRQALAGVWRSRGETLPATRTVLLAFLVAQLLVAVAVCVAVWLAGAPLGLEGGAWNAISAFASLGWLHGSDLRGFAWVIAVAALLGGLGWPVWLAFFGPTAWRRQLVPRVLWALLGYAAFLALIAGLVTAIEVPRGRGRALGRGDALANQSAGVRYGRSTVQVMAAAGAGIPTERIADRGVAEGTKVVLALMLLVGGLGGAAAGGIQWIVLMWALAGFGGGGDADTRRLRRAAGASAFALIAFTGVVAMGLLIIESRTASGLEIPPSFGDALIESASGVAGGNLSSGLTETITGANLSRGMGQAVDLYQYGMVWLMAAMIIGRCLPIFMFEIFAERS